MGDIYIHCFYHLDPSPPFYPYSCYYYVTSTSVEIINPTPWSLSSDSLASNNLFLHLTSATQFQGHLQKRHYL